MPKDYTIYYYRLIASAVIHRGDEILIGKKDPDDEHPVKGQWVFPAGYVEGEESPFDSVIREVKEETGLDVKVNKVIDFVPILNMWKKEFDCWYTFIYFDCTPIGGEAKASDDLIDLKWVKAKEIDQYLTDRKPPKGSKLEKFINSLG